MLKPLGFCQKCKIVFERVLRIKLFLKCTFILIIFSFYGCAAFHKAPEHPQILLYEKYRTKALEFEKKDEFRIALYYWKIADGLTLNKKESAFYISNLQKQITTAVEKHFERGVNFYSKNLTDQAIDEFLIIIRYNPDHAEALQYLKAIQSGKKYTQYEQEAIAEELVESREKVQEIREYVSDVISKPLDNKESFFVVDSVPEIKQVIDESSLREHEKNKADKIIEVKANLLKAKSCFNNQDYDQTISITSKILEHDPENSEAMALKNASYFSKGNLLQLKKNNVEALKMFRNVEPGYKDVSKKILVLEKQLKQSANFYYKRGVRLFVNEKLEAAITQWHKALKLNPKHREAQKGIKEARSILEKLKKLK
ncbi:MAG: hypothetical protein JJV89_05930 [Desulfosarcina sp.]|nr:hypothetical protein [Desulfobacterales bacterium]